MNKTSVQKNIWLKMEPTLLLLLLFSSRPREPLHSEKGRTIIGSFSFGWDFASRITSGGERREKGLLQEQETQHQGGERAKETSPPIIKQSLKQMENIISKNVCQKLFARTHPHEFIVRQKRERRIQIQHWEENTAVWKKNPFFVCPKTQFSVFIIPRFPNALPRKTPRGAKVKNINRKLPQ